MKTDNRVLIRKGARTLTLEETQLVGGALQVHTNVCSIVQTTGHGFGDGDGCGHDSDVA